MRAMIAWGLAVGLGLAGVAPVQAQRILERVGRFVEQQVLPRLDQALDAPRGAAPIPAFPQVDGFPQDDGAPPLAQVATQEPGYFGVIADDSATAGRGVQVVSIRSRAPAELAGLKPGDLITAVDGRTVRNLDEFGQALAGRPVGNRLEVIFERGDRRYAAQVTLGLRPDTVEPPAAPPALSEPQLGVLPPPAAANPAGPPQLGVRVLTVTEGARLGYGIFVRSGAVIETIERGSPAERAGLPVGGVIVSVGGRVVRDPQELANIVRTTRWGDVLDVQFYRGNQLYRRAVALVPAGTAWPEAEAREEPPLVLRPKITEFPPPRARDDDSGVPPLPTPPLDALPPPPSDPAGGLPDLLADPADVPPSVAELERRIAELERRRDGAAAGPDAVPGTSTPEQLRDRIALVERESQRLRAEADRLERLLGELRARLKTMEDGKAEPQPEPTDR